jgi:glycerol-3-phosphate acyltransferase PlsX
MIKIAVDAMGSDNGSPIVVEAVKKFLNDYNDVELTVYGKAEELKELDGLVKIVDCKDVMGMEEGALQIMRRKETSMIKAIEGAKNDDLDGVVSAGSTGAFLTAATIYLKLIEGIQRAALVSPFPTVGDKSVIILDIGANNENTPEHLVQFAKMGKIFSKVYNNIETPRVYLLSNGAEEKKGSPEVKEAHQILKNSNFEGFKGNIEARYVLSGEADVVVTGGFAGNVILKGAEGVAKMFGTLIKKAFKKNIFTKIGYLFARSGIKEMQQKMDYKSYGGAMLLGVNKVVVKGHGSSDARSFYHAIRVTYELIKKDMINKMKEELK